MVALTKALRFQAYYLNVVRCQISKGNNKELWIAMQWLEWGKKTTKAKKTSALKMDCLGRNVQGESEGSWSLSSGGKDLGTLRLSVLDVQTPRRHWKCHCIFSAGLSQLQKLQLWSVAVTPCVARTFKHLNHAPVHQPQETRLYCVTNELVFLCDYRMGLSVTLYSSFFVVYLSWIASNIALISRPA